MWTLIKPHKRKLVHNKTKLVNKYPKFNHPLLRSLLIQLRIKSLFEFAMCVCILRILHKLQYIRVEYLTKSHRIRAKFAAHISSLYLYLGWLLSTSLLLSGAFRPLAIRVLAIKYCLLFVSSLLYFWQICTIRLNS